MVDRFIVSLLTGILVALVYVVVGLVINPFAPEDTWSDLWHFVMPCTVIGGFGGAIVGRLWGLPMAVRRLKRGQGDGRAAHPV